MADEANKQQPEAQPEVKPTDHAKLALDLAKDYCIDKGVKQGLTQNQQTGILVRAVEEVTGMELTQEDKVSLFNVFYHLANGSALRQRLEAAGTLAKSEPKGRQVNATAFL